MVDVYKSLSLFGKLIASLKLTRLWPSLVLTLYIVTATNSFPVENKRAAHLVVSDLIYC